MNTLFLDLEAAPAEDAEQFKPEFAPSRNLKDSEKIKADLAAKEAKWREGLALSPLTGRVLVVGLIEADAFTYKDGQEKEQVEFALQFVNECICRGGRVVGHNVIGFDLPFLIRRAYKLGVHVPSTLHLNYGRHWHENIMDTMLMWRCGDYQEFISLDTLAKCLGVGQKTGSGKDFAALYAKDRGKALAYLENDLRLTKACYEKMTI